MAQALLNILLMLMLFENSRKTRDAAAPAEKSADCRCDICLAATTVSGPRARAVDEAHQDDFSDPTADYAAA